MVYDFDTVVNRWGTDSEKYDGLKKFAPEAPEGSIPLWIADMDFKTSPQIVQAMRLRVEEGVFGYTDLYGASYFETVCEWMRGRYGWNVKPEEIVADSGVVPAVLHGLSLMAGPGDGVIIHTPAYQPFYDSIKKAGMVPAFSKLNLRQGRYEIDFEDLELKARAEKNRILLLCSPHNPTGRVWTEEELTRMMDIARKYGLKVICDEIHCDIVRQGICFTPLAKLFPWDKTIITCTSPSKSFNLAGNHLANVIIPDPELRKRWNRQFHYMPNPVSVEAVKAAYGLSSGWLEELNRYLDNTFSKMERYFKENLPKAGFYVPEATYLAWIDMRGYGIEHGDMVRRFMQNGVIIEGGEKFVDNGSGFIRMNVAVPYSTIETVLNKIKHIFN